MSIKSVEAFIQQVQSGQMSSDKHRLYNMLLQKPHRLDDFRRMGFAHQTVTARLSQLGDAGLIWEDSKGYFHITKADEIAIRAKDREVARYRKWRQMGEKNGWFNLNHLPL